MRGVGPNFTATATVSAVDTLIAGDVVRVVLDGCPHLKAGNAAEALQELRTEHQAFRSFLIEPPCGRDDINAALLLPSFSSEAARTAIMAEHFGYAPVAGTLLMAAAVVLVDAGYVTSHEPAATVILDTAHGKSEVIVSMKDGHATSAKWMTDRPRIIVRSKQFLLEDDRSVPAAIISPGLPYLVVHADDLRVNFESLQELGVSGAMLSRAAGQQLPLKELAMEQDASSYLVMVVGDCTGGDDDKPAHIPAAWIGPSGNISNSPAGTGALAVAAYCVEMGQLAIGRPLDVVTPSGNKLRSQINDVGANVEGAVSIFAAINLFQ